MRLFQTHHSAVVNFPQLYMGILFTPFIIHERRKIFRRAILSFRHMHRYVLYTRLNHFLVSVTFLYSKTFYANVSSF